MKASDLAAAVQMNEDLHHAKDLYWFMHEAAEQGIDLHIKISGMFPIGMGAKGGEEIEFKTTAKNSAALRDELMTYFRGVFDRVLVNMASIGVEPDINLEDEFNDEQEA